MVPFLFQARDIMSQADRRVAAHVLLRSLIAAPYARRVRDQREGETSGLRWRVVAPSRSSLPMLPPRQGARLGAGPHHRDRLLGAGAQGHRAETMRLGRPP